MPSANEFIIEAFTLLGFATVFVALRTVSRLLSVGFKQFQVDDFLMIFAIILYGLETGAAYIVGAWFHGLANSGWTTAERKAMSLHPDSENYRLSVGGSKVQVTGWCLYTLLLWTLKACMCVFYSRLTSGLDNMKIRVRVGYGLIGVSYLAVLFSILFGCYPLHMNWQIYPNPGNHCQPAISRVNCLVTVVLNVLTDLYLMSIPLPLLWKAQMPLTRKALLIFMFSGGFFVIACGILRCVLILVDPVTGAEQAGSWAVRETFVAVIIGNLPMVYQLFRRQTKSITDKVMSVHRSRNASRHAPLSGDGRITGDHKSPSYAVYDSAQISQTSTSKKSRFRHPLSLNTGGGTFSESQEELQMENMKNDGCVITTELSVEAERSHAPSQDIDSEELEYSRTGWIGRRSKHSGA